MYHNYYNVLYSNMCLVHDLRQRPQELLRNRLQGLLDPHSLFVLVCLSMNGSRDTTIYIYIYM